MNAIAEDVLKALSDAEGERVVRIGLPREDILSMHEEQKPPPLPDDLLQAFGSHSTKLIDQHARFLADWELSRLRLLKLLDEGGQIGTMFGKPLYVGDGGVETADPEYTVGSLKGREAMMGGCP